ncbi:MAG: hypothetical protein J2P36_22980, partial [Ktedonobacteraceae bacterium]|nr:hypothetical protein [Ktedonobacteraceae bacterium]
MKKADEAPTTPQPLEDIAEITAATDSDTAEDDNGNGHTPTIQLTHSIKKHRKMDERKPPIDSEIAVSESASTEQAIRSEDEVEEAEIQETREATSEQTAETQDIEEPETTEETKKEDITKEEIIEVNDAEKIEAEDTTATNDVEEVDTQTEEEIEDTTTAQDIEEIEAKIAIEAQDPSEIEAQESEEDKDYLEAAAEVEKKTAAIQATAETIATDPTEITEVENTEEVEETEIGEEEEVEEATATQGAITEAEEEETTTIQAPKEVEETEVREDDEEDDTQRLRVLPTRPGQTPAATQPKTEAKDDEDLSLIETQSLLRTPASVNTEQARLDQQSASKSISSNEPTATAPTKHQSVEQDTDQPDVIENYRARLLHEPPGIIQPAKVQDDANEQSLLKRLQRFFLGEQQHS